MRLFCNPKALSLTRKACSTSFPARFRKDITKRAISSSKLTIEKTTDAVRFENKPKKEELQFGQTISDHMLIIEWDKDNQWSAPKIVPYQDLKISPAASCLNYGTIIWDLSSLFSLQYFIQCFVFFIDTYIFFLRCTTIAFC